MPFLAEFGDSLSAGDRGWGPVLHVEQLPRLIRRHGRALGERGQLRRPADQLGVVLDRLTLAEAHGVLHAHPEMATGGQGSYFIVSKGCTEGYETTIAFD